MQFNKPSRALMLLEGYLVFDSCRIMSTFVAHHFT